MAANSKTRYQSLCEGAKRAISRARTRPTWLGPDPGADQLLKAATVHRTGRRPPLILIMVASEHFNDLTVERVLRIRDPHELLLLTSYCGSILLAL